MILPCPVAPVRPGFSLPCRFSSGAHGGQRPRPAGGQLSSPLGTQGAVLRAAGQGQHKTALVRDLFTRRGHFCGAPVTEPRRPPSARRLRAPKWRPRPALPASPLPGDEPSPHPPSPPHPDNDTYRASAPGRNYISQRAPRPELQRASLRVPSDYISQRAAGAPANRRGPGWGVRRRGVGFRGGQGGGEEAARRKRRR